MLVYFELDTDITEPCLLSLPEGAVIYASDSHYVLAEIPEGEAEAFLEKSNNHMTYDKDVADGWYFGTCSQVYVANGVVRDDLKMLRDVLEALPYEAVIEHTGHVLVGEFVGNPKEAIDELDCRALLIPSRLDNGTIQVLVSGGALVEEFVVYSK